MTPPAKKQILGIDPGLASTGVAVIERTDAGWRLVDAHETRTTAARDMPGRLHVIHELVADAIRRHAPDAIAIESIFFAKNVKSAVLMAHGRGVAILAAADARVPVFEYSAREIKQSVVGGGGASKTQVMRMVKAILGLAEEPASDHQADAMACALAHAYRSQLTLRLKEIAVGEKAEDQAQGVARNKELLAMARKGRRRRR